MRKHARNYMRIYNQHNLPYLAQPGSDLFAAARLDHLQRMERDYYRRRMAGQSEEEAQEAVQKEFDNPIVSALSVWTLGRMNFAGRGGGQGREVTLQAV